MTRRDRDEAPRIVYAYRTINDHLRDSLIKRHVWFSNPLRFNDPYDCALPILDHSNPQDAMECVNSLLLRYPAPSAEFEARALMEAKSGKVILASQIIQEWRNGMERSGVICFSENPDNILMWSHYASQHQGICLGFEFGDNRHVLQKVTYSDYLPNIPLVELVKEDNAESLRTFCQTKSRDWAYEHEWRLIHLAPPFDSDHDKSRALSIQPEMLRRVIFGWRIKPERREELKRLLKDWPTPIHFYQAKPHSSRFKVQLTRFA
jgi:Protein of unknown function (DUF2971)